MSQSGRVSKECGKFKPKHLMEAWTAPDFRGNESLSFSRSLASTLRCELTDPVFNKGYGCVAASGLEEVILEILSILNKINIVNQLLLNQYLTNSTR